jgi:hypothetical protein
VPEHAVSGANDPTVAQVDGEKPAQSPPEPPPDVPDPRTLERVAVMNRPLESAIVKVSRGTQPLVIAVNALPEFWIGEPVMVINVGRSGDTV